MFRYHQSLGMLAANNTCDLAIKFMIESSKGQFQPGQAAQIGIYMHEVMERYLKKQDDGNEVPLPLKLFVDNYKFTPQNLERTMQAESGRFLMEGTLDAISDCGVGMDWKFVQRPWDTKKRDLYTNIQAYPYMWLARQNGINITQFIYLVNWTDQQLDLDMEWNQLLPIFIPYDEERVNYSIRQAEARYSSWLNLYNSNSFAATPSKWNCRWCNYKSVCEYAI